MSNARSISKRLAAAEKTLPGGRVYFLIYGRDKAEHEQRIAELQQQRVASDGDKFVCIFRRWPDAEIPAPRGPFPWSG